MTWVLDASAAVEVVLGRRHSYKIIDIMSNADRVIAPELFIAEVANVYWKYYTFEKMSKTHYFKYASETIELVDDFVRHSIILESALNIASENKLTIYDALYMSLAQDAEGIGLITLDKKVRAAARKMEIVINKL